jgi:hypothetical protein
LGGWRQPIAWFVAAKVMLYVLAAQPMKLSPLADAAGFATVKARVLKLAKNAAKLGR